jgi:hypothetical protein
LTIKRRSFLAGLCSLFPALSLAGYPPSLDKNGDIELMHRIVKSFPDQTNHDLFKNGTPANTTCMAFLLTIKDDADPGKLRISIKQAVADAAVDYQLSDIFSENINERDYTNHDRFRMATPDALEVSAIVSAANRIARQTMRGMGNHYAVFSDHILVWYSRTPVDTPVCRLGKNVVIHPNRDDYFFKVKGISLTWKHHRMLRKLGYKRVS